MRALALLGLLIASPGWAQGKPADCPQIVEQLKATSQAKGDKAGVEMLWDTFLEECEARMGGPGATFNADERMAISKVLHPETDK